ncbi:MAG TPA: protease pro-enzyme activation domain-containing protein [Desulfuromonadaceae bacterium]|nr:protease pro-enzyme activation domain-containing protein [Desulfuromonadaceae bacterium]
MRNSLLKVGMGLAVLNLGVFSSVAADPGMKTLSGHVLPAVARLQKSSDVAPDTDLTLTLGLPLRNEGELSNLLEQVYDPANSNFHRFLSPDQFASRFGPTAEDYQKVVDYAKANGLKIVETTPNRMLVRVQGKAANVQNAFHVALHNYQHPTEGRQFYAPDTEPAVPTSVPVQDISGLDNYRRPHPKYHPKKMPNVKSKDLTGTGPIGSYMGDDFRRAYVPGSSLNGAGQSVALVQFDGYLASDITNYETLAGGGRTNITLQNVLLDGFNGLPTGNGGEGEVSLDIEMVGSMAPALSKIIVYEGDPYNFHPNDVLNRIATDNLAKQVSCSWGWTGGPNTTTDQIFRQMAVQGQSFYNASGDSDAFPASGPGSVDDPFSFGEPSCSPFITQVGGTTLTMNTTSNTYSSETVWNWGIRFGADGVGSSGGISLSYSIPSWQTNVSFTASQGSAIHRNIPDVAMTADDVLVISDGGFMSVAGGTSCAAPLWAGFTALINQQAVASGHGSVGFVTPALYALAATPAYTNYFHDITTGNNRWSGSPSLFDAVTNYDLCTGLGTPNGTNLIFALAVQNNVVTHLSPPPSPFGSTMASVAGSNPNGDWNLFVVDDFSQDSGTNYNGWSLTLTLGSPVGDAADNLLAMTSTPDPVFVNSNIVYVLGVTNYGPSISSNVFVTDVLPLDAVLVSSNATQGTVIRTGTQVIWTIGTLATNASAKVTLTVRPTSTGSFINSASVDAVTADPNPSDDFVTSTVTVDSPVHPQLTLTNSGSLFTFGVITPANQVNIIEQSTNLNTGIWTPVYTNVGSFTYTNLFTPNYPDLYFRVRMGP